MNLKGKKCVITGGASGIGLAIVRVFAKAGAEAILILDLKKPGLIMSDPLDFKKTDISNSTDVDAAFEQISGFDVLINNAGIDLPYDLSQPERAVWQKVMDTNLTGTKYVTEKFIEMLRKENRPGSIVFNTSVHTAMAFPGGAAYDASKHALVGLMRTIALEYGQYSIRANAVAPGFVYPTGITGGFPEAKAKELGSRVPLKRHGSPEEIAQAFLFLASDASGYISGAELRVDGGLGIKNALF